MNVQHPLKKKKNPCTLHFFVKLSNLYLFLINYGIILFISDSSRMANIYTVPLHCHTRVFKQLPNLSP